MVLRRMEAKYTNKRVIGVITICIGVFMATTSFSQWTKSKLPIPEDVIIYDIDFETETKGWAVGTDGYILFYDGNTWEVDSIIAGNTFGRVTFPVENEGWATTVEGKVYKYNGAQWNLDFSTTGGKALFTLHFVSQDEGFISGADGYIAYYNGTNWAEGNIGFDSFTLTSHFFDNKNGWLSSDAGQLYQFADSIWSSVTIPSTGAFNEMTFLTPDVGYGASFSKEIWKYNGADWTVDYTGENDQFTSLFFLDEHQGWAGGNGYIATFYNGVWTEELVDTGWIFDIYFTNDGRGWAMGVNGDLLTCESPYASSIWTPIDFIPSDLEITTMTSTANMIYAAGNSNDPLNRFTSLFTSENGATWSEINTGLENYALFYTLHTFDNVLLASVADDNIIPSLLKSEDGGLTWNTSQNGMVINSTVQYITSTSDGTLYASTYTLENNNYIPRLYQSTDQAATWTELNLTGLPASSSSLFISIAYTGSEFVTSYINYETGVVALYTSIDGIAWSKSINTPTDFFPLDITIDNNDIWYISGINLNNLDGEMYSSGNKGFSWKALPTTGLDEYNHWLVTMEWFNNELFLGGSLENRADGSKLFSTSSARQSQTITFDELASVTYGDDSFSLNGSSSSGLSVTYSSSNTSVAAIVNDEVIIGNAGSTIITATQQGNDEFESAQAIEQTLTVNKALLTVSVKDEERFFQEPNPSFELTYDGFQNGDDIEVIDMIPTASTEAIASSVPGDYEIIVANGADNNYDFLYSSGTLTVLAPAVTNTDALFHNSIKVFPNPTSDNIQITCCSGNSETQTVQIFDTVGDHLFTGKFKNKMAINLSGYPDGMYLLTVTNQNGVHNFKILKK